LCTLRSLRIASIGDLTYKDPFRLVGEDFGKIAGEAVGIQPGSKIWQVAERIM